MKKNIVTVILAVLTAVPAMAQRIGVIADVGHEAAAALAEEKLGNIEGIELVDRALFQFVTELAVGDDLRFDSQLAADGLLRFMNVRHKNMSVPAVSLTIINPGAMIDLDVLDIDERRTAYAAPEKIAELGVEMALSASPRLKQGGDLIPVTLLAVEYRAAEMRTFLQEARLRQMLTMNLLRYPQLAVADRERIGDFAWDTMFTSGSSGAFWNAAWLVRVTVRRSGAENKRQAEINLSRADGTQMEAVVLPEHEGTWDDLAAVIATGIFDALTGETVDLSELETGREAEELARRAAQIRNYDPVRAAELAEAAWMMGHRRYLNGRIVIETRLQRLIGQKAAHIPDSAAQPPDPVKFNERAFYAKYGRRPDVETMAAILEEMCDIHREALRHVDEYRTRRGWWWALLRNPYLIGLRIQSIAHSLGYTQVLNRQLRENAMLMARQRDLLIAPHAWSLAGYEWLDHLHLVALNADDYVSWLIGFIESHLEDGSPLASVFFYRRGNALYRWFDRTPPGMALGMLTFDETISRDRPPRVMLSSQDKQAMRPLVDEYKEKLRTRTDLTSRLLMLNIDVRLLDDESLLDVRRKEHNQTLLQLLGEIMDNPETDGLRTFKWRVSLWTDAVKRINQDRPDQSRMFLVMHRKASRMDAEFVGNFFSRAYEFDAKRDHQEMTDDDLYAFYEEYNRSRLPAGEQGPFGEPVYFEKEIRQLAARMGRPDPFAERNTQMDPETLEADRPLTAGPAVFYASLIEQHTGEAAGRLRVRGIHCDYLAVHDIDNMLIMLIPVWESGSEPDIVRLPEPHDPRMRLYNLWLKLVAVDRKWIVMRAFSAFPGRGIFYVCRRETGDWNEYLVMDDAGRTEQRIGMPRENAVLGMNQLDSMLTGNIFSASGMYQRDNLLAGNIFYDGNGNGIAALNLETGESRWVNKASTHGPLDGLEQPRSRSNTPLNAGGGKIALLDIRTGGRRNPDMLSLRKHIFDPSVPQWTTTESDISKMAEHHRHHTRHTTYLLRRYLHYGGLDANIVSVGNKLLIDTVTGETSEYPPDWRELKPFIFMHNYPFRPFESQNSNGEIELAVADDKLAMHRIRFSGLRNPRAIYACAVHDGKALFYTSSHFQVLNLFETPE